ncbi:MAG: DUF1572 domain-containing protein [Chitinophagaceae bacterium]|nr:DUF1572 domain-containing protein [Chitinophagaceae bacterium]
MNLESGFLKDSIKRLRYYKELGDKTLEQLSDDDFYIQPSSESNSIAVIIRHLHGNMLSRWTNFLTEDGEKPWRNRDTEFEAGELSTQELIAIWNEGWNCLFNTLESLSPTDLIKTIHIRTEPLLVYDAILRQMAHYPYHVGQIAYIGRWIKNDKWISLSIAKGASDAFNNQMQSGNKTH